MKIGETSEKLMLENFRKSSKFMKIVEIDENREDS